MNNIISLADEANDRFHATIESSLKKALKNYKNGDISGDKMLILILDDSEDKYCVHVQNVGISTPEEISLLEHVKHNSLQEWYESYQ